MAAAGRDGCMKCLHELRRPGVEWGRVGRRHVPAPGSGAWGPFCPGGPSVPDVRCRAWTPMHAPKPPHLRWISSATASARFVRYVESEGWTSGMATRRRGRAQASSSGTDRRGTCPGREGRGAWPAVERGATQQGGANGRLLGTSRIAPGSSGPGTACRASCEPSFPRPEGRGGGERQQWESGERQHQVCGRLSR